MYKVGELVFYSSYSGDPELVIEINLIDKEIKTHIHSSDNRSEDYKWFDPVTDIFCV